MSENENKNKILVVGSGMTADQITETLKDDPHAILVDESTSIADWKHNIGETLEKARLSLTGALTKAVDKLPSLELINERTEALAKRLVESAKNQLNPEPRNKIEEILLKGEKKEPIYIDGPHYTNRARRREGEKRRRRKWKRASKEAAFIEAVIQHSDLGPDAARLQAEFALETWTNNMPPLQRLAYLNAEKMRGRGLTR